MKLEGTHTNDILPFCMMVVTPTIEIVLHHFALFGSSTLEVVHVKMMAPRAPAFSSCGVGLTLRINCLCGQSLCQICYFTSNGLYKAIGSMKNWGLLDGCGFKL